MKLPTRLASLLILLVAIASLAMVAPTPVAPPSPDTPPDARAAKIRFESVDVFVDAGSESLAAYQFELAVEKGQAIVVGLEGGDHAAFKEPPYYDPEALKGSRIIVAAFNTGDALPTGKTRVARLHMQVTGDTRPEYVVKLDVAARKDGAKVPAKATVGP